MDPDVRYCTVYLSTFVVHKDSPQILVWQPLILVNSHVVQACRSFDLATRRLRHPKYSAD